MSNSIKLYEVTDMRNSKVIGTNLKVTDVARIINMGTATIKNKMLHDKEYIKGFYKVNYVKEENITKEVLDKVKNNTDADTFFPQSLLDDWDNTVKVFRRTAFA